jgi:hypothetical protein
LGYGSSVSRQAGHDISRSSVARSVGCGGAAVGAGLVGEL